MITMLCSASITYLFTYQIPLFGNSLPLHCQNPYHAHRPHEPHVRGEKQCTRIFFESLL